MRIDVARSCPASPAALWTLVADLEAWPRWCPVFTLVQPDGPLAVGSRVRVLQPGLRVVMWTVDALQPGRMLRWSTRGAGFAMVAERLLIPEGAGTDIRLSLAVTGPMAWAVALIVRRPMRRYLAREADCLSARASPTA